MQKRNKTEGLAYNSMDESRTYGGDLIVDKKGLARGIAINLMESIQSLPQPENGHFYKDESGVLMVKLSASLREDARLESLGQKATWMDFVTAFAEHDVGNNPHNADGREWLKDPEIKQLLLEQAERLAWVFLKHWDEYMRYQGVLCEAEMAQCDAVSRLRDEPNELPWGGAALLFPPDHPFTQSFVAMRSISVVLYEDPLPEYSRTFILDTPFVSHWLNLQVARDVVKAFQKGGIPAECTRVSYEGWRCTQFP